ncbi:MAG: hypothetical protein ACJ8DC_06360, partial [Gemmatimonadales bacterium]
MSRMGFTLAALVLWGRPLQIAPTQGVRELLASARGAPALLCSLAADAIGNSGWKSHRTEAPVTPLGQLEPPPSGDAERVQASPEDVRLLLESLSATDGCVREIAVRLLGTQAGGSIVAG